MHISTLAAEFVCNLDSAVYFRNNSLRSRTVQGILDVQRKPLFSNSRLIAGQNSDTRLGVIFYDVSEFS